MVNLPSYLQLTPHGTYYFRIAIPKPLRLYFKKRELKKSLRTSNRKKAASQALALSIDANSLFERIYFMAGNGKGNNGDSSPTLSHAAFLITKKGDVKYEIDSDKDIDSELEALAKLNP
jgi:hypothetical protein